MLKGQLVRGKSTNDGTPGRLTLDNGFECDTLELPWRNNKTGASCTRADLYAAALWESPRLGSPNHIEVTRADGSTFDLFRKVYRFADAHGRRDCLIHNANFAGEVTAGEETQLHGCTAVGRTFGRLRNRFGNMQMGILNSVRTLEALILSTGGDDLEIEYSWADGCEPEDLTDAQEV